MFTRVRLIGLLVLLLPLQIYASVFGTVKAIVHDPQHRPVKGRGGGGAQPHFIVPAKGQPPMKMALPW